MNNLLKDIAIIGMSGRFPRAKDLDKFWQNIRERVECISFFSDAEMLSSGVDPSLINRPDYIKASAVIEDIEMFDASFFGFNPRDAEITDPQQRFFLECAWEALENAGYIEENYEGLIGVYAGASSSSYLINNLHSNRALIDTVGDYKIAIANDKDFLATCISYKLNLKGPSISIQTACSTSLVAIVFACQSLQGYHCDMALAGGVSLKVPQNSGYLYKEGMISSPDGHCRAFDAKGRGIVSGNGLGVVILKRLADALSDGDRIRAVIKGSAVNNDGAMKVGYTAPSVDGQADVIAMAQDMAGIEAQTIGYVEAHGTGTPLGDPIEIAALTKAFRYSTEKKGFCAIGSVKTNIGHLDAAAGVAGLIKTVLALENKQLPPSLHFEKPNPEIDFINSPFYVNTALSEWKTDEYPRRAAVSSFGIGGTNAHIIVEEAPLLEPSSPSRTWQLLLLSAKTEIALATATKKLVEHLENNVNLNLPDVAYTLHVGRKRFSHRRIVVCQDLEDAVFAFDTLNPEKVYSAVEESKDRSIVFMFSGQGSQYVNMALELYQAEHKFREQVDLCAEILKPCLGSDIRDVLYPKRENIEDAARQLTRTAFTQPALFVIEYALSKLLDEWGIRPQAMIGHSIGEYVAACMAGVLSLEEALRLVAKRGELIQSLPDGAMLAVAIAEKDVPPLLNKNLSLAAINSPSTSVISGTKDAIGALEKELVKKGVRCSYLNTSHAFHSQMVEPVLTSFIECVKKINLKPPQMKYISNVTGTWITADQATNPEYWVSHLRQTVRFSDGVAELLRPENAILIEIGPGRAVSTLAKQNTNIAGTHTVLSSLRHPREQESDVVFLLKTVGRLWIAGVNVDWGGFYRKEKRCRVPLPTYPFERQRYWIEPIRQTDRGGSRESLPHKKEDMADWFYVPSWNRTVSPMLSKPGTMAEKSGNWLVFTDNSGLGDKLVKRLIQSRQDVISVMAGNEFSHLTMDTFIINPNVPDDYIALIKELKELDRLPNRIVHLWNITIDNYMHSGIDFFYNIQNKGFYSLLYFVQALEKHDLSNLFEIDVITNSLYEVTGEEALCPEKATILGPCKVIPQEYPNIKCRCIDVDVTASENGQQEKLIERLIEEFSAKPSNSAIAYRGLYRWVQNFERVQIDKVDDERPVILREKGVYLIIGGLGRIGFAISGYLAKTVKAKLIVTVGSNLPSRKEWKQWLETHDSKDGVSIKIKRALLLEEMGGEVMVVSADIANIEQMQGVVELCYKELGCINGVIHSAGVVKKSFYEIRDTKTSVCNLQFQPKVDGLFVLEKVIHGRKIDFCIIMSSLSSALGGLGLASYSAANLFMDIFVQKYRQTGSGHWIIINWDGWQPEEDEDRNIDFKAKQEELNITSKEGVEVFRRILSMKRLPQVVVSTGDLPARIRRWIDQGITFNAGSPEIEKPTQHARHEVSTDYKIPADEVECAIADIWQKLLGINKVGASDNYFELGGDSLSATLVLTRVREIFKVEIPINRFFENASLSALADFVRQAQLFKKNQLKVNREKQKGYEEI